MAGSKKRQHHVIYVPGLGDKNIHAQKLAVWGWRSYGLYGHCHPVGWSNGEESFDHKLTAVIQEIDELFEAGHIVSLIGSSAGASMVLHAYAARKNKIAGVVLICGELADAKHVDPAYYAENPAFKVSMERLPATLKKLRFNDRQRIVSIRPWFDEIVRIRDMYLEGARIFSTISFGHAATIGMTLTLDFFIPYWFLSKWARRTPPSSISR